MNQRDREMVDKVLDLKARRQAVILAHNYQRGEVQDIADFVGDSLELSQKAAQSESGVIVFCGVHFMAETASILCPDKTVLLPDAHAGCPMANMITADALRKKKAEHPNAMVLCYVNSTAEVKAESDICCTSANAARILARFPREQEIMFVPDQYLGSYAAGKAGRKVILWPGYCPTHAKIMPEDIQRQRSEHPRAKVIVHPECRPDVIALADEVASTSGICRYAAREDVHELIVGTEMGIIHRLKKENPSKVFIPVSDKAICPNMKLITLEKILWCLEEMSPVVKVPEEVRVRALAAVQRMLES